MFSTSISQRSVIYAGKVEKVTSSSHSRGSNWARAPSHGNEVLLHTQLLSLAQNLLGKEPFLLLLALPNTAVFGAPQAYLTPWHAKALLSTVVLGQNSSKASQWSCYNTEVLFCSSARTLNLELLKKTARKTAWGGKGRAKQHYWKSCKYFQQKTTAIQKCKEVLTIKERSLPQKQLNAALPNQLQSALFEW